MSFNAVSRGLPALLGLAALAASAATIDTRPVPPKNLSSPLPADWHHGAFMEIFVRAWKDSFVSTDIAAPAAKANELN